MNLQQWMNRNNVSNTALAIIVDVHNSYVSHIKKNTRRPSPELALKIQEATNGEVTVMELLYPKIQELSNKEANSTMA